MSVLEVRHAIESAIPLWVLLVVYALVMLIGIAYIAISNRGRK